MNVGELSPAAYCALLIGRAESDRYHYIQRARTDLCGMRAYFIQRARMANRDMIKQIRNLREVAA
jgi:hypothetical protein